MRTATGYAEMIRSLGDGKSGRHRNERRGEIMLVGDGIRRAQVEEFAIQVPIRFGDVFAHALDIRGITTTMCSARGFQVYPLTPVIPTSD